MGLGGHCCCGRGRRGDADRACHPARAPDGLLPAVRDHDDLDHSDSTGEQLRPLEGDPTMRHLSTVAAAVLMLLPWASTVLAAEAEQNVELIKNGGAELVQRGQPAGWDIAAIAAPGLKL